MKKKITSALISVFSKDGLEDIVKLLSKHGVKIISTGGTAEFIRKHNISVTEVETIAKFPAIFGGRVKTLQPQIFGGILNRRDNKEDQKEKAEHKIEDIDLVIVDLYPFEETLASGANEENIIEKIDIGGISLIRAAAKNFNDVVVISSKHQYQELTNILNLGNETSLEERRKFAGAGFEVTSKYDAAIRGYFQGTSLRYGENPHQKAEFVGNLEESFTQLHGKELSYNNLIDTEAAILTVTDFQKPAFAIIKHMNACGLAVREEGELFEAYKAAYDADPVSAFGGILAANRTITEDIAKLIKEVKLFIEVIIAPDFSKEALAILMEKKDCRILKWNNPNLPTKQNRTCFTGILSQDRDTHVETGEDLTVVTKRAPDERERKDLLIAAVTTKHLKSNSVALVKDGTLLAMGCGQTSRIDALKQAIDKAQRIQQFGFSLQGAVLSSEAFFPFPDCVELAAKVGVTAVIQPGGSKNDQASIDMADKYNLAMATTGFRHFKH
ncbi:bifunctional phosphoribosylaminoimidazolecarboxamide formyltransferase/IMP cyclohydrolase [Candidatus Nomurabacteria bacterium RIFCSPLOWO2_02_40_28]|uniref:Bifunctional purine biosynthesis protein PurH n=2 Tax=Candidatus Nomuraibacteriota TaxID=1752729 RepID=A0A837HVE2_9BACT|nr:MAG: Phosphoribosylaminoimidazolecarboxamide formyltransferase/IMP cyclohydrolase [Candidatus Nomurabacteria bacterium GW2011_GWD2_39_12]KKR21000.1 MAG: Phosphoribosylaminoimidazolecarboxamide formyltransferase/IMP cyclohydrolase [Candidatus Nomurabacteria bacterium GW2011_GWC2_39_41]KKR37002.1 MAG: Phosphoribosylaminoimidazolecarboxamide formyltransferase/IMP cyclohydrolase [Candidatus Nomurabacteria bacterium GW2011_GWE2_40_10]KKR38949.1 MAG: Phosphoribosylaminoimidazolecarboxamide formyltr